MTDFSPRPHGAQTKFAPTRAGAATEPSGPPPPVTEAGAPPAMPDDAVTLPVGKFICGLFRTRWLIGGLVVAFGLIATMQALLQPNEYGSTGEFLLKAGAEQMAVSPIVGDDASQQNALGGNLPHILLSHELLRRVVERVSPAAILAPAPGPDAATRQASFAARLRGWFADLRDRFVPFDPTMASTRDAIDVLASQLRVDNPAKSSTYVVGYTCTDPERAESLLAIYMEEAVKRHIEIYSDATGIRLVEENHEKAKAALDAALDRYQGLLSRLAIDDFAQEFDARRQALEAVRRSEQELTNRVRNNELKKREFEQRLASIQPLVEEKIIEKRDNPRIAQIDAEIHAKDREIADLRAQFRRADDLALRTAEAAVAALQAQLEAEHKQPFVEATTIRTSPNPRLALLQARLEEVGLELDVDRHSLEEMRSGRTALETRHAEMITARVEHANLEAAVERCRKQFEASEAAIGLASTKKMLNLAQASSLTVMQRPTNAIKSGPQRSKIAATGVLIGLFLGLALAFLRTVSDRAVRSTEDLYSTGVGPVLATLPYLRGSSLRRHRKLLHQAG